MADKFQKSIKWLGLDDTYYFLPLVTDGDDGAVLGVVNGEWVVVHMPSNLPSVTEADNGKVLGVSSGQWTVLELPATSSTPVTIYRWVE